MKKTGISESELRVHESNEVRSLKSQLRDAENLLSEYKKDTGKVSVLMDEVLSAVRVSPKVEIKPFRTDSSAVDSPCSVVFQITDSHHGAVQSKSEIEGFGEYSPEISERRQAQFVKNALKWASCHTAYKIDEAVVLVTGDLISGDIHKELQVTNAFPTPVQSVEAARILATQVLQISGCFPKVRVEFICEDNHGRLELKPQAKEAGFNNWNFVIANISKQMLKDQDNVEFNFYPQFEKCVSVKGRRYLLCHGHGIQGWMGIPYYSIDRKVGKEAVKRMHAPTTAQFDLIVMGHYHTPMAAPLYWIGPSVSGTDAYDHKNGRFGNPAQVAWMVHPKNGEFDRTVFNLI